MFRTSASRTAYRVLGGLAPVPRASFASKLCTLSKNRPQAVGKPMTLALARYASQQSPMDHINKKHEQELGQQKLKADPDVVSTTSSTHPVFGEVGMAEDPNKDADMMAGVKSDMVRTTLTHRLPDSTLTRRRRKPSRRHSHWKVSLVRPTPSEWLACFPTSELHFQPSTVPGKLIMHMPLAAAC